MCAGKEQSQGHLAANLWPLVSLFDSVYSKLDQATPPSPNQSSLKLENDHKAFMPSSISSEVHSFDVSYMPGTVVTFRTWKKNLRGRGRPKGKDPVISRWPCARGKEKARRNRKERGKPGLDMETLVRTSPSSRERGKSFIRSLRMERGHMWRQRGKPWQ